jgi:hypothetical protein
MRSRWRELAALGLLTSFLLSGAVPAGHAIAESRLWTSAGGGERVPATVRLADDVQDPLFALLAGLIDADVFGSVDGAFIDSVMTKEGGTSLPYHLIASLQREPGKAHRHAVVRVRFHDEFEVPVPYSILGYHPGDMSSDRSLVLWEWILGDRSFRVPTSEDPDRTVHVEDLHLFGIEAGHVDLDVDWWLDKLMGKKLDDVDVTGFLLFRREGARYGVAFGYTESGRGRSGVFDLGSDEILFPAPREYLVMGARMRAQMEAMFERAGQAPPR